MSERNSGIISNVLWKFAERILAQLVSLVVSIILAHLLLPEDYGNVSMVMIFITIANAFVTNGIPSALIQKKEVSDADFSSVFYFNLLISLILYFFLFVAASYIASFYQSPILVPVVRVMGFRILIASVNSVQHAYVSRKMMFRKYFFSTLFGTVMSGIAGVVMAYMGYGVWALVAQYMINTIVDTIVLFITVEWRPTRYFSIRSVLDMLFFGWKILFESLSATLEEQLRSLIIGKVYTASDLAYYSKAQQFPSLMLNNIASSVNSVLFPAVSARQDNKKEVLELLRKSIKVTSYTIFPMLTGLAVIARPLTIVLMTDKWIEMVPYMRIFCILSAAVVGMAPRHQALNGTGRSDVFMYEHLAVRIIGLILLILTYKISIFAIVLSSVFSSVMMCGVVMFTSRKYNGYAYKDQLMDVIPIIAGCIIMAVPVILLGKLQLSNIVTLVLQVAIGFFIYIVYSVLLKLEGFEILKEYLERILKTNKDFYGRKQ